MPLCAGFGERFPRRGEAMQTLKREQTRGVRGHAPSEILTFKSSEIAKNGYKTVHSDGFFFKYYCYLKQRVTTCRPGPHV